MEKTVFSFEFTGVASAGTIHVPGILGGDWLFAYLGVVPILSPGQSWIPGGQGFFEAVASDDDEIRQLSLAGDQAGKTWTVLVAR